MKPSASCALLKPVPIETVAPVRLAVSTSLSVKALLMTVAAWFSVYASPLEAAITGASLVPVTVSTSVAVFDTSVAKSLTV